MHLGFLRKNLLDPRVLAACVLSDALAGGFPDGHGEALFAAALAAPSPALPIKAMLR